MQNVVMNLMASCFFSCSKLKALQNLSHMLVERQYYIKLKCSGGCPACVH